MAIREKSYEQQMEEMGEKLTALSKNVLSYNTGKYPKWTKTYYEAAKRYSFTLTIESGTNQENKYKRLTLSRIIKELACVFYYYCVTLSAFERSKEQGRIVGKIAIQPDQVFFHSSLADPRGCMS